MAIPQTTLENWTKYESAAIGSAKKTHRRIRNGLEKSTVLKGLRFETFLQGSYSNTTLVRGSGDVDIVVKLDQSWLSNLSQLDMEEKIHYSKNTPSASYPWGRFKSDVIDVLRSKYGDAAIEVGDKAVEVESDSLPIGADIVVSLQYRRYSSIEEYPGEYTEGIVFWNETTEERIENFPKQHKQNGEKKQDETEGRFKETVRLFKNARNELVERNWIVKDDVPSYFIECLLYNVPPEQYQHDLKERYQGIVEYLAKFLKEDFRCQNEIHSMFGTEPTHWSLDNAEMFVQSLQRLNEDY